MTLEEATERILQGNPWVFCLPCDGTGEVRIEGGKGTDGCPVCEGYRNALDEDYREACHLLGKELPERPVPQTRVTRILFPTFQIDKLTVNQPYEYPISQIIDEAVLLDAANIADLEAAEVFDDS